MPYMCPAARPAEHTAHSLLIHGRRHAVHVVLQRDVLLVGLQGVNEVGLRRGGPWSCGPWPCAVSSSPVSRGLPTQLPGMARPPRAAAWPRGAPDCHGGTPHTLQQALGHLAARRPQGGHAQGKELAQGAAIYFACSSPR